MDKELNSGSFFTELKEAISPAIGDVGPYQILREVAHGGQGIVYQALDRRDGTLVALKRSYESNGVVHKKLMRGTELVATLDHPSILPITGIESGSNTIWIASPWIEGRPVDVWAREKTRTIDEKIEVFKKICAAISHAHYRGIIHRDLRPANVLIREDGHPYILDFGIAKRISNPYDFSVESQTVLAGDIRYLPPEVLNQTCTHADVRQDVYALGVLFFVMLTGRHPLDDETPNNCFRRIAFEGVFDSAIDSLLQGSQGSIIRKATSHDLNARYRTAIELVTDIEDDMRGLPIQAITHTKRYLLTRYLHRHKYSIAAGVAGLVVLIATTQYLRAHARVERELRASNMSTLLVLTGFIDSLGPTRELGPSMESVAVLEFVSDRVMQLKLSGNDDLDLQSAALHESISRSFLQIRRAELGINHARIAHQIHTDIQDLDHHATQRSGALLAKLYIESHQPKEAEQLTRSLVNEVEPARIGLPSHLLNLSIALIRQQKMYQARPYIDEYLSRFENDTAEYTLGLDTSVIYYNNLGKPLLGLRDADEMCRIQTDLFGKEDARTLSSRLLRVKSLQMLGRFEEERAELLELVPMVKHTFGESDPRAIQSMAHLAICETELGFGEEALPKARFLLTHSIEKTGTDSWSSTQCRFLIAHALLASGRPEEVVELITPEIPRIQERMKSNPKARNQPAFWVAKAYNDLGNHALAMEMIEPAVMDLRANLGKEHPQTLQCEYEYFRASSPEMSDPERQRAIEDLAAMYAQTYGHEHPHTIAIRNHSVVISP